MTTAAPRMIRAWARRRLWYAAGVGGAALALAGFFVWPWYQERAQCLEAMELAREAVAGVEPQRGVVRVVGRPHHVAPVPPAGQEPLATAQELGPQAAASECRAGEDEQDLGEAVGGAALRRRFIRQLRSPQTAAAPAELQVGANEQAQPNYGAGERRRSPTRMVKLDFHLSFGIVSRHQLRNHR